MCGGGEWKKWLDRGGGGIEVCTTDEWGKVGGECVIV